MNNRTYAFCISLAVCPEAPSLGTNESFLSQCPSLESGRMCTLSCLPGTVPTRDLQTGVIGLRQLTCGQSGRWTSQSESTGEIIQVFNDSQLLNCTQPTCQSDLGFTVEGFECEFSRNVTLYEFNVSFAIEQSVSIVVAENGTRESLLLEPGRNLLERNVDGVTYSFVVHMAGALRLYSSS